MENKKNKKKTLIVFEEVPDDVKFFEAEGDLTQFDGVYVNSVDYGTQDEQDALNDLIFNEEGTYRFPELEKPTKDWDFCIRCGFFL